MSRLVRLYASNLLKTETILAAGDDLTGEKPRSGAFWCEGGKILTLDGQPRFPNLANLMAGLLSIPASNAREFSVLRKIHIDQRPTLQQATIIALMSIKFNDKCNFQCKKATVVSLNRKFISYPHTCNRTTIKIV